MFVRNECVTPIRESPSRKGFVQGNSDMPIYIVPSMSSATWRISASRRISSPCGYIERYLSNSISSYSSFAAVAAFAAFAVAAVLSAAAASASGSMIKSAMSISALRGKAFGKTERMRPSSIIASSIVR